MRQANEKKMEVRFRLACLDKLRPAMSIYYKSLTRENSNFGIFTATLLSVSFSLKGKAN